MKIIVSYQLKSGALKEKAFIKESIKEALAFFKWRYGHTIVSYCAIM